MRILQIGAGGIGSYFTEEFCNAMYRCQIAADLVVADDDMVELEQIKYQNFSIDNIGANKAEALAYKFKAFGVKAIKKKITRVMDLKDYDFIVLCVDNELARTMVVNHCFIHKKEFLDLRAEGRRISAFPKLARKEDNLAFIDQADSGSYSCQDKNSLKKGWIDLGNKTVAIIGVQMLLNSSRGLKNKPVNLVI